MLPSTAMFQKTRLLLFRHENSVMSICKCVHALCCAMRRVPFSPFSVRTSLCAWFYFYLPVKWRAT